MASNQLDDLYRRVIMDHYKHPRNKGSIDRGAVTIDMNNPTCGDRIHLTLEVEGDRIRDAKFDGEGCSISMSSASMMTEVVKGKTVDEALRMSEAFSNMMLGEEPGEAIDLDDAEALAGVAKFPARIKCATLSWKAMEKGIQTETQHGEGN